MVQLGPQGEVGINAGLGLSAAPACRAQLVDSALPRLRAVALLCAGLLVVHLGGNIAAHILSGYSFPLPRLAVAIRVLGLLDALGLIWVLRSKRFDGQTKCDLGLAFEVSFAYVLVSTELIISAATQMPVGPASPILVWMMLFRLLIPATPIKAATASFASALMLVAAERTMVWGTGMNLEPRVAVARVGAALLTAALAWWVSRWMYRIRTAAAQAEVLGSYRLEAKLGEGGMGEVWRASHHMLKRPAAIKLIRPEVLGASTGDSKASIVERFEHEAQSTARLFSPHTIQLYDFGTTRDGSFYYVMELLDGLDLDSLVKTYGPVSSARAAHFLRQACHSLEEAHQAGLIHRDIKPANLFACRRGQERDWIKVLDFGLVKRVNEDAAEVQMTSAELTTGTPAFMAPEIALGHQTLDRRTDLYMLGCVGYWLLTGVLVFEGNTALEVISSHIHEVPLAPSTRTELDVPQAMDKVIMACLEKDPANRPQSAQSIRDALDGLNADWTRTRARRWWDQHRIGSGAG